MAWLAHGKARRARGAKSLIANRVSFLFVDCRRATSGGAEDGSDCGGKRHRDNSAGSDAPPQFEHHRAHERFGLVGCGETGAIDQIPAPLDMQPRRIFHVIWMSHDCPPVSGQQMS
tara:strand:+ start:3800 stop:4147 length:348 start_codon:yes stop_codon:yes gene_type:complete